MALVIAASSGCGPRETAGPAALTFFCGAGLRPPVAELVAAFEKQAGAPVLTDYAGSEHHLARIKVSGSGDVFMPGDASYVEIATGQGLVSLRRTVCHLVPAILVAKGNPKGIASLGDLLREDVRLGLGDENACAIGPVCRKIFEKNGLAWGDVQRRVRFQAPTVNALGDHIAIGSLDAVIVWDGVAAGFLDHGQMIGIPPSQNVIAAVEAVVLKTSKTPGLAEQFVEFLAGEAAKDVFRRHGYTIGLPPGAPAP